MSSHNGLLYILSETRQSMNNRWICQHLHFTNKKVNSTGEMIYPPTQWERKSKHWKQELWILGVCLSGIFLKYYYCFSNASSMSLPHGKLPKKGNFTRHCHSIADPCNGKDPVLVSILGGKNDRYREGNKKINHWNRTVMNSLEKHLGLTKNIFEKIATVVTGDLNP